MSGEDIDNSNGLLNEMTGLASRAEPDSLVIEKSVIEGMLEEIQKLENENKNCQARYNALLETNQYLRRKGKRAAVTYSGFTKEEVRLMVNHMHPDKHSGKDIYNTITMKLNTIKDGA